MEWLEITAASVQTAKEKALVHLGVHESEAEFEVVSEEKVGLLFRRVKQEARVRARVVPAPVRSKEARGRAGNSRKTGSSRRSRASGTPSTAATESRSGGRSSRRGTAGQQSRRSGGAEDASPRSADRQRQQDTDNTKDKKPMTHDQHGGPSLLEQAELAESFVQGVAETLGISFTFERHDVEDGILRIEATGDDIGVVVGRRGVTAQAIDELVRTVLQRSGGTIREGKIRVDIGGVRARRAAALTEFTREMARQVIETGEEIALEPMDRVDRKIVHDAIADIDGVDSLSEGEEPNRRVVVTVPSD